MKIKTRYSNLLILGICIYILFQIVTFFMGKFTKTLLLENKKIELKINKKGLIIREETLIKANSDGYLNMNVEEGEKVKRNQEIGKIGTSNKLVKINEELKILNNDIEKLENDLKNSSNKLDSEIKLKNLETKKTQRNLLNTQRDELTKIIYTPSSGIISYKYDENEDIFTAEDLDSIKEKDIENSNNNYKDIDLNKEKVKQDDILARVINSQFVYVAVSLSKEESKYFEQNEEVKLSLNNESFNAYIENIYENGEKYIAIFKISDQNIGIYDTRVAEFDIIYKQMEALKIPKDSISKINNKEGVYVIDERTGDSEFVELKGIEYKDDKFIYINTYKNKVNNIKTVNNYDEIILKPNNINKNIKVR